MWGTSPYPHRCSKQAATTNFTPALAPTCFNLLPSTLNFIFLMKCHLLTSGRIIIKRNGHKAVLCRKHPCQLAPLLNLGEEGSTVILCSQLLEYPKPVLRGKMAQTAPFQVSGPSSMQLWEVQATSSCCCYAENNLVPRTSKMIQTSCWSPGRALCDGSAPNEKDKMVGKPSLMVNSAWHSPLSSSECLEPS